MGGYNWSRDYAQDEKHSAVSVSRTNHKNVFVFFLSRLVTSDRNIAVRQK